MSSATVQGALWGARAEQWATRQEKMHVPLYRSALDGLGDVRGKSLLDAGCGSGMFLEMAAHHGATVVGLDASAGLLEVARRRVPQARLDEGDIEQLPYTDGEFQIVTAFNAIQYAANPVAALRELRRVCAAAGYVLIGQWADPSRCQTEELFVALRKLAPPPPGAPQPIALAGAGQLEARMVEADLHPIRWGEAECPFEYDSLEDAWLAQQAAGPIARVVEAAGEEKTRESVIAAFRGGLQADGSVRHQNVMRWVVASP